MSNSTVINQFKEKVLSGGVATLMLGDSVYEKESGFRRGEGSISVWPSTNPDLINVNDEARGFRGTQRIDAVLRIADEELKVAEENGAVLSIREGHRNRTALGL